jgi:23S rRNA (uracil1939-C5)-methyltransferase
MPDTPTTTSRSAAPHAALDSGEEIGAGLDLVVDQLVAGGEGLARPEGHPVVFVRGALPGEHVRAQLVEVHRGYRRAELLDVVSRSPARVEPPCPSVARGCGGCDLQHAAPGSQPELKAAMVVDSLRRIAHIEEPLVEIGAALPPTAFRTTVRAAVHDGRMGFRRHRSHDVVVTDGCLVAHPLVDEVVREGRFGDASEVTVRVGAATGDRLVVIDPSAGDVVVPDGTVVVGADELRAGRRVWIHEEVVGRRWRISARSFFQTRPDGAAALADAVVRAAGEALGGARVVDTYAGVGLLSAAVLGLDGSAAAASVVAVERSASSVADAKVNLAGLHARVVRSAVERWRPSRADVVVADPSRVGLGRSGVDVLHATRAPVLVLVSCDVAALGRDAALLAERGFRFEQAELVDLFPHSHHVEVVSRFVR